MRLGSRILLGTLLGFVCLGAASAEEIPLKNWTVPVYSLSGLGKAVDATPPRAFIGLPPCRIADTRGGAPISGGMFTGGSDVRTWTIVGLCGVPAGADAVSLNWTVTGPTAIGFLTAWPAGGAVPTSSILNFAAGQQIANAAILPLSAGGAITVNVSAPTHVILDINGYFSDVQGTPANFFRLEGNINVGPIIVGENSGDGVGVQGISNRTDNLGTGVSGRHAGAGTGVFGEAVATSGTFRSRGVFGTSRSLTGGSAGVLGLASASTGRTYGVEGVSLSSDLGAAGVYGEDASGGVATAFYPAAGVRGGSANWFGVLGVTLDGFGDSGVSGVLANGVGGVIVQGSLARNVGANDYGVFSFGDYGGTGAKYFVEPHPRQAEMVIRYVALEGPESGTYFRGRGKFQNGLATIEVPEDFRMVTDEEGLSVQLTPIGEIASFAVLRVGLDQIVVKGSRNVEFFYLVHGVRRSHKHLRPVGPGQEYMPESPSATMPAYLTEVQKQLLIENGTYKADGTVNPETAKALGWDRVWEKLVKGSGQEKAVRPAALGHPGKEE